MNRFWNVWPNLRTMEKTLNVLYSTGTILLLDRFHEHACIMKSGRGIHLKATLDINNHSTELRT